MKYLIVILLILTMATKALCQKDNRVPKKSGAILKVDVLNALNPIDPSLLGTLEHFPFRGDFSLIHELGFVTNIRSHDNVDIVNSLKTRHELRYYLEGGVKPYGPNPYVGIDFQYRRLVVNEEYVIGFDCEGGCDYYRKFNGNIKTDKYIMQFRIGSQGALGDKFVIDGNFGIGLGEYQLNRESILGGTLVETDRFLTENKFKQRFEISIQGKIGYIF